MRDTVPHIRPAGVSTAPESPDHVALLFSGAQPATTSLPGTLQRFSRTTDNIGRTVTHYGKALDAPPPENMRFGHQNIKDGSVKDCFSATAQLAERYPAPKVASPQDALKDRVFGVASKRSDSAKEALYPQRNDVEEPLQKPRMVMDRPAGATYKNPVSNGVFMAMHMDDPESGAIIVDMRVTQMREWRKPSVGVSRPLGSNPHVQYHTDAQVVYGRPSGRGNEAHVADCFTSVADDDEAGSHSSRKKHAHQVDPKMVFGMPSIRRDKPEPKARSVADNFNYGNEPDARGVVFPPKYAEVGVYETDFVARRSFNELWEIVSEALHVDQPTFEGVWMHCVQALGGDMERPETESVSVEMWRRVYNQLRGL